MERFVLIVTHGDGCTWSATETVPVEYDNKESLWVELNDAIKKAYNEKKYDFEFAGRTFCVDWFMESTEKGYRLLEYPVDEHQIQTIDEWFFYYE